MKTRLGILVALLFAPLAALAKKPVRRSVTTCGCSLARPWAMPNIWRTPETAEARA
jgi:hypothetical protein